MITHKFKCTECGRVKSHDFGSIFIYESKCDKIYHESKKCNGKLERYYGSGDVPAIRTTSSPNR